MGRGQVRDAWTMDRMSYGLATRTRDDRHYEKNAVGRIPFRWSSFLCIGLLHRPLPTSARLAASAGSAPVSGDTRHLNPALQPPPYLGTLLAPC